jgi:membrane-associated protein
VTQTQLAILDLAVRHHHHFFVHLHPHGPPIGYAGIGIAAFLSWIGFIGAGEAALVTAGVFAARGRLDIGTVMLIAWAGAYVGGIAGWLIGRRTGKILAEARGPLYRLRRNAVRAGERFFKRYGSLAVFLTPSWVAGVNQLSAAKYLPASAVAALLWVTAFGLGTYFIGPGVVSYIDEAGVLGAIALGVVAVTLGGLTLLRRRRSRLAGRPPGND